LSKLEAYGVASKELLLFKDYLKERRQSVVIDGVQSEYRLITHGVPQGSVLGPLLFIIFVNDLPQEVSRSIVDIYADDTTLSTSAPVLDLPVIQQRLQDDINKIADWTSENRMVLNASKTKSLLVTGKRLEKKAPDKDLKISCNDSEIEQVTSQKLLGVKLDSHLNFTEHIDDLCKKVFQRIAVLSNKRKRNLPLAEHKLFFNALIKPKMLYGSCAWSTASEENVKRVSSLQKRAARVILDGDIGERSEVLFNRWLDWLPLKDELNLQKSSLIFMRINNETHCPSYITELLPRNSDRHCRNSRKYNLVCPYYNRESEGGRSFQVRAIKLWNKIPLDVRKKNTIGSFKSALKKHFLNSVTKA